MPHAIAPAPSLKDIPRQPQLVLKAKPGPSFTFHVSFRQAFGLLGVPILMLALVCILWTTWLIILAIAPNATANYLMGTGAFDNGTFWLIIDPEPVLMVFTVLSLSLVVFGYLYVLALMTILRNRKRRSTHIHPLIEARLLKIQTYRRLSARWAETTSFHGLYRKYWNLWLKAIDLTVQSITLSQYLNRGCPTLLIYGFVIIVAVNSFVYALGILTPGHHSAFSEVLVDSMFDLLVAVLFPILVLAYCYKYFQLDRDVILLNLKIYPPGSFERAVRLTSDPAQTALFRLMFDSLRVQSKLDFVLRISMNMSFCYRFIRVVQILINMRHQTLTGAKHSAASNANCPSSRLRVFRQYSLPRPVALAFLMFSTMALVATHQAITFSQARCTKHPECVAYVYRWPIADSSKLLCPCIALIDVDRAPKTYEEWKNPKNVTALVAHLASTGDLRVLQLINRRFTEWPDELKHCSNLQHITLIYTGTTYFPPWASHFRMLEYLHVEGKENELNLQALPDDLFASMKWLSFIHLAVHYQLRALPAFDGLENIKALSLALLASLRELPSFMPLTRLERLWLIALPSLETIPDMAPLRNLAQFELISRGQICCNGFLDSICDLSHPYCEQNAYFMIPAATCLGDNDTHATESTVAMVHRFSESVCQIFEIPGGDPIEQASVDLCGGVLFRHCPADEYGVAGICTSARMRVITCIHDSFVIVMRKEQIRLKIGAPCNDTEESWLGCSP